MNDKFKITNHSTRCGSLQRWIKDVTEYLLKNNPNGIITSKFVCRQIEVLPKTPFDLNKSVMLIGFKVSNVFPYLILSNRYISNPFYWKCHLKLVRSFRVCMLDMVWHITSEQHIVQLNGITRHLQLHLSTFSVSVPTWRRGELLAFECAIFHRSFTNIGILYITEWPNGHIHIAWKPNSQYCSMAHSTTQCKWIMA